MSNRDEIERVGGALADGAERYGAKLKAEGLELKGRIQNGQGTVEDEDRLFIITLQLFHLAQFASAVESFGSTQTEVDKLIAELKDKDTKLN